MHEDEFRELQIRMIDLSSKVNKINTFSKLIASIKANIFVTTLFMSLVLIITISHIMLKADINKHTTLASIKNSYVIKNHIDKHHSGKHELYVIGGR